jgi:hypothetical protein
MLTLETTDAKLARRCRYDQHRFQKTTLTIMGSVVTGLVRSVLEIKSGSPTRWILTIITRPDSAMDQNHASGKTVKLSSPVYSTPLSPGKGRYLVRPRKPLTAPE